MELFRGRPGSGWATAVSQVKSGGGGVDEFLAWAAQGENERMALTKAKTGACPETPSAGTRRVGEGGGGSIISGS